MRKRTFTFFIATFIIMLTLSMFFATFASATETEDLLKAPGLTDEERSAVAKAISRSSSSGYIPSNIRGMMEWKEMGNAFAETIKTVCHTLNVEVNEFLKSDVGKLTAVVIIYKMIGKDILIILLYIGIWLIITFVLGLSIKFLHMKKIINSIVKDPNDKTKQIVVQTTTDRFGWDDDDSKTISLILHIVAWFIFSCVLAVNIL